MACLQRAKIVELVLVELVRGQSGFGIVEDGGRERRVAYATTHNLVQESTALLVAPHGPVRVRA